MTNRPTDEDPWAQLADVPVVLRPAMKTLHAVGAGGTRRDWQRALADVERAAEGSGDTQAIAFSTKIRIMVAANADRPDIAEVALDRTRSRLRGTPAMAELELAAVQIHWLQDDWTAVDQALARSRLADGERPLTWDAQRALADMQTLVPDARRVGERALAKYHDLEHGPSIGSLHGNLARLLFIQGEPARAAAFAKASTETRGWLGDGGVQWRQVDVQLVETARRLLNADFDGFRDDHARLEEASREMNYRGVLACASALRARLAVIRQTPSEYSSALASAAAIARELAPLYRAGMHYFEIFRRLLDGHALSTDPMPGTVTTWSLGGVLCYGEALAIAGNGEDSQAWLRWAETQKEIVTSLEWPVLFDRVVGVVALRCGKRQEAERRFAAAGERHELAPIEAAIARLQRAELQRMDGNRSSSSEPIDVLHQAGVPPAPWVAQVQSAWIGPREPVAPPTPTVNELEVLRCLARDLSYAEAARELRKSPSTVKTLAKRAYGKLEADGREDGLRAARARGLI